jgi:decaprenylphospho-beta-D-erythro-pentofuranosid-2-ulose 2-reductase
MKKNNMVAVGATSAIAKACLEARAKSFGRVALISRDAEALGALASHLEALAPGLCARWWVCDLADLEACERAWSDALAFCGSVDEAIVAAGVLGDQSAMEADPLSAARLLMVNSVGCSAWALWIAQAMERQGAGVLAIITSVAGMRGRASNCIYGSSKAQMIALAEGLRSRLWRRGARVVDFRPGMVDTPMTAKLPKGPLMANAQTVGAKLAWALAHGDGVIYSPGYWRWVMAVIKNLPFAAMKRMRF